MSRLTSVSTEPGRIFNYNNQAQFGSSLPYSCKLRVYKKDLTGELIRTSKDLRWGAGVKLILDGFQKEEPAKNKIKWQFYLPESHPDYENITAHQKQFLASEDEWKEHYENENIVPIFVSDSMDVRNDDHESPIEESWKDFYYWVVNGFSDDSIIVDLSNLRPYGTTNSVGLTATGAVGDGTEGSNTASFLAIYEYLAIYAQDPSIFNFLKLFGVLNNTIRRGGLYKNGIVTSSMWYENPNINEYLDCPLTEIPGSHKKGISFDKKILTNQNLVDTVLQKVRSESLFLAKQKRDTNVYMNVCISGDSWITTTAGVFQVKELVGKPFVAVVDGELHSSTEKGFWSNGVKPTIRLSLQSGSEIKLTPDHRVIRATRKNYTSAYVEEWIEAQELIPGDLVRVDEGTTSWKGSGTFEEGWALGNMVGDGFFTSDVSACLSKKAALEELLSSYSKSAYRKPAYSKVESIVQVDAEEVFDCTIPSLGYFVANGILVHNCMGLEVPDNGTCLIWRVNLGAAKTRQDIVDGYKDAAKNLTELHVSWRKDNPEKAQYSTPLELDDQIGLDTMGLANLLRIQGIQYKHFIQGLVSYNKGKTVLGDEVYSLISTLDDAMQSAIEVSDQIMIENGLKPLDRVFCVEPAQSHSYETFDCEGFTTCRGIWPPVGRKVARKSDTVSQKIYRHGAVETVLELTEDEYELLNEEFQVFLDASGRGHGISYDLRREPTQEWFEHFIDGPLKTKYYTEINSTDQSYLKKTAGLAHQ